MDELLIKLATLVEVGKINKDTPYPFLIIGFGGKRYKKVHKEV